jgi:type III secretion protein L
MTEKPEVPLTAGIALTEGELLLTAVVGKRIPRRAWSSVNEMSHLVAEAERVVLAARSQAESLRRRAYTQGRALGVAQGQAEAAGYIVDAQRQARELIDASEQRIIGLAVSIVQHIAPELNQNGELVAALAAQALSAVHEERHLQVNVSRGAERATKTLLERWQQMHPEVESVQVSVDPELEPFACVVESELGRIEVRLSEQLEAVHERLVAAAEAGT